VCAGVISERENLRRDNVSITKTRPKGTWLARGRVEGQDLRDVENHLSQNAKKSQEEEHNYRWIRQRMRYGPSESTSSHIEERTGDQIWAVRSSAKDR
jgi:hypothetical protein